jgi:Na+/melibiose symporter-like transporter
VFATIGFALKCGLALGSAAFLWIMAGVFHFQAAATPTAETLQGYRICSTLVVGILFALCTILLLAYPINQRMTAQMSAELAARRPKIAV